MSNESPNTECGRLNPWRASLFLAAGVAMAANGVLTVVKETVAPVKGLLSSLGGHHWPGQAIVLLVLLPVLAGIFHGAGLGNKLAPHPCRIGMTIMLGAVSSLLLIAGFYILE